MIDLKDLDKITIDVNGKFSLPSNVTDPTSRLSGHSSHRSGFEPVLATRLLAIYFDNKEQIEKMKIANENLIDLIQKAMLA
jgi:hypothetical protein